MNYPGRACAVAANPARNALPKKPAKLPKRRCAQEEAWQKALDDQLKFLDRKKRLGEINTQEEIRQLERIEAHYAKTTQQKVAA